MSKKDDLGKLFPGRFIFAIILTAAAMLLLGAGRLGDSMVSRQAEHGNAHRQWQNAVSRVLRRGSAERRKYLELQMSYKSTSMPAFESLYAASEPARPAPMTAAFCILISLF